MTAATVESPTTAEAVLAAASACQRARELCDSAGRVLSRAYAANPADPALPSLAAAFARADAGVDYAHAVLAAVSAEHRKSPR